MAETSMAVAFKPEQPTPKRSSTTGKRNHVFGFFGVNCPFNSCVAIHTLKNITTLRAPAEASREEGQKTVFEMQRDSEWRAAEVPSCVRHSCRPHSHTHTGCCHVHAGPDLRFAWIECKTPFQADKKNMPVCLLTAKLLILWLQIEPQIWWWYEDVSQNAFPNIRSCSCVP